MGAESGHMQGLVVVGFIVDEILSHMQGLVVVGFIVDEILRVGFKNDKVTRARNICQGH